MIHIFVLDFCFVCPSELNIFGFFVLRVTKCIWVLQQAVYDSYIVTWLTNVIFIKKNILAIRRLYGNVSFWNFERFIYFKSAAHIVFKVFISVICVWLQLWGILLLNLVQLGPSVLVWLVAIGLDNGSLVQCWFSSRVNL